MARISARETLEALKSKNPPKLAIIGSAKATEGRTHTLIKIRPSILRRLQGVALGPVYLLLEYSMLRLVEELEQVPNGMTKTIDAATFNASPEDIAEVEAAKGRVKPGRVMNRMRTKGQWSEPADAPAAEPEAVPAALEYPVRGNAAAKAAYARKVAAAAEAQKPAKTEKPKTKQES